MQRTLVMAILSAAVAAWAAGCAGDFYPASYLNDLRVIAIGSDPVEAGPGETVRLMPVRYLPPGETITSERWSFCPVSAGPSGGFACAVPQCETAMTPGADGAVTADPSALALACFEALGGAAPKAAGGAAPANLTVDFRYAVTSSAGLTRDTVLQYTLWLARPPEPRNRNPVIAAVNVGEDFVRDGEVAMPVKAGDSRVVHVSVDPTTLDAYTDDTGAARTEDPIVSYFTTAGRFDSDRSSGAESSVTWTAEKLEAGQDQAAFYIVVRDGRGGLAVGGPYLVPIGR